MSQSPQDRIPSDLYGRLENWGRAMRITREQGKSITGIICDDMASHAGQGAMGKEREASSDPIDRLDAATLEAVWRTLPPPLKQIVRAHFVIGLSRSATCRALKIRVRDYDDELVRAAGEFGSRLAAFRCPMDRTEEMRAMV